MSDVLTLEPEAAREPERPRSRGPLSAAIAVAWVGLAASALLAWRHAHPASTGVCGEGSGCERVLESRWSEVGGVPIAWLGVALHASIAALLVGAAGSAGAGRGRVLRVASALALVATLASGVLVFLQVGVVRAFCALCTTSAAAAAIEGVVAAVPPGAPSARGVCAVRWRRLVVDRRSTCATTTGRTQADPPRRMRLSRRRRRHLPREARVGRAPSPTAPSSRRRGARTPSIQRRRPGRGRRREVTDCARAGAGVTESGAAARDVLDDGEQRRRDYPRSSRTSRPPPSGRRARSTVLAHGAMAPRACCRFRARSDAKRSPRRGAAGQRRDHVLPLPATARSHGRVRGGQDARRAPVRTPGAGHAGIGRDRGGARRLRPRARPRRSSSRVTATRRAASASSRCRRCSSTAAGSAAPSSTRSSSGSSTTRRASRG